MMAKPLVILAGPTAVGKSALSVKLAKRINGSIISADSMQVYKGMDIGTAKISPEEMQGIPHYLIDVLDPHEDFNIVRFQEMAKEAIDRIISSGRIPIMVGGTGFYIQSVLYDIDFTYGEDLAEYRSYLQDLIDEKGSVYVHDMLKEVDPDAAEAIHHNDHKRMIRALEYNKQTGMKISGHNRESANRRACYDHCYFVLNDDRSLIYERIDKRVDEMITAGLESEVRTLLSQGLSKDNVSMHGLGYKEMIDCIEGRCTLEDAVYTIKRDSRHFAKRQLTWFKREKDVIWLNRNEDPDIMGTIIKHLIKRGIVNE